LVGLPRISEFFGLTITLEGTLLEGDLGPRATRLVAEWCTERAGELRHAWDCASNGRDIPWVLPLR
jgi:hypothetical protein